MPNGISRSIILSSLALAVLLSCVVTLPSSRAQQPISKPEAVPKLPRVSSHIILISISGLRSDFSADAEASRLRVPTIQSLRAKGSFAIGVESVFPSQTNPAHATIATGTLPADHGIYSDYPFDERSATQAEGQYASAKEIKTDAIWELAGRAKLITAAVGFPITANATINFNLPDNFEEPDAKLDDNPPGLRDEILSALKPESVAKPVGRKDKVFIQPQDLFRATAAVYLIEKHRPNLLLINFSSFDLTQRRYGLLSEESVKSLEQIDELIKKIVDATIRSQIGDGATFIIVSDHGAARTEREFNPNVALAKKGWLSVGAQGRIVSWRAVAQTFGGSAAIFVRNPQDENFVREVEELFSQQYEKPDSPIWRVISRRDAARLGADPRAALYLDAAPSYAMSSRTTGSTISKAAERATRGYSPSRSEMRATLIFAGKGIKPGVKIEYARLIDIAPTIAGLFGLEMKTARGRVIAEVIN
ncbi:MAG: alkaline phosphatase family protein [Blastocatellia bacterium]